MLKSLTVENYALIESLHVEWDEHLNIITGETGAGKSILLGALGLLLGAKNEGQATKDLERKPAYDALDELINHEWKTNTTVKADENGKVQFRGFKGKYRITYKDNKGKTKTMEYILK